MNDGLYYFDAKSGFSLNEGGRPANLHVRWKKPIGFYVNLFGFRIYWFGYGIGVEARPSRKKRP